MNASTSLNPVPKRPPKAPGPKLVVTGYGRHGKDSLCDYLAPLRFVSSSMFVCQRAVFPVLAVEQGYRTVWECYSDRHQHRQRWYDLICEYNAADQARLSRELFAEFDIYCGLRNVRELEAARLEGLFDLAIWVDASARVEPEPGTSISITPEDCDVVVSNNGSLQALRGKAEALLRALGVTG